MGLSVGDQMPHFSLPDQEGNRFELEKYLGRKPLVIFFYPKDHTPGCIKEVCNFRDRYEDFAEMGAVVVGISSDSPRTHQGFRSRYHLPFPLLSDTGNKVRKAFGVKGPLMNLLPGRETYVTDKEGKIIMVYNSAKASHHTDRALNALKNEILT